MLKFDDPSFVVAIAYLAQAVIGISLFIVFKYFGKLYKQHFLGLWANGWIFFAVSMVAFFFLTSGFAYMPANHTLGMLISWTSMAFSYAHIVLLIMGTYELLRGTNINQKKVVIWVFVVGILSILLVLAFSQIPSYSSYRYFIRVGLRYGVTAISFIFIGITLLQKKRSGIGYKLLSGSMLLFGLMQAYYFYIVLSFLVGNPKPLPALFGIVDLVLMSGLGMGMLIGLLEDERARLNKANKEMDSFLYSTSHDLRAPIASILGLVNLAKIELHDETSLKYFGMVENRVKKMDMVIGDILQLARSTKADLEFERIDFQKILQEVIADVKFNKGAKAIELHYAADVSHVLQSDYNQLKIILGNLISNAVKYHHVEQDHPFIAVRFTSQSNEILLEVEDNGTGIAKEHQEKIFNMFFRASTQSEGTGLGLYIVNEAVNKLQGTIVVKSEKNKGTTFTVRLPKVNEQ
jgi:signal transduction histidine kinase